MIASPMILLPQAIMPVVSLLLVVAWRPGAREEEEKEKALRSSLFSYGPPPGTTTECAALFVSRTALPGGGREKNQGYIPQHRTPG